MRWIDAPVGRSASIKCLALGVLPSYQESSVSQQQQPIPGLWGGRNGAQTRSMESTAGAGIGFGRRWICYWWRMVPVYGTGQGTNRRGIYRLRISCFGSLSLTGLERVKLDLRWIDWAGRVTPTGMWSSRSYLRKDQADPYTLIRPKPIEAMRSIELPLLSMFEFCLLITAGAQPLLYIAGSIGKRDKT